MNYKLIYKDEELGEAWREEFHGIAEVEILDADICQTPCDAIVSPANSFGFMDGSLDYFLSERFGWALQDRLQEIIKIRPMRELLIGEALILSTHDKEVPWLISAPTMRVPMRLRQTVNAYLAMKAILISVLNHREQPEIEIVAIPGLGTGCGALPPKVAAFQMATAYKEIVLGSFEYPESFGAAQKTHFELNPDDINIWDP